MEHVRLTIDQREKEGIVILDLHGHLILGAEDLMLRQRLLSVLDSGVRNVIVNLEGVTKIDTSGIGSLAFCALKFKESGGRLVLLNLPDILNLDTALEGYADEQAAVNSFFPERAVPHYDLLEFLRTTPSITERTK